MDPTPLSESESTPTPTASSTPNEKGSTSGAIIGGVVAGVLLLCCVIIGATIFILRIRRRARLQREGIAAEKFAPGRAIMGHRQRPSDIVAMRPLLDHPASWLSTGGRARGMSGNYSVDYSGTSTPLVHSRHLSNDVEPVMIRDPNNMKYGFAVPGTVPTRSRPATPDVPPIVIPSSPPSSYGTKPPIERRVTIESVPSQTVSPASAYSMPSAGSHLQRGIESTLLSAPPVPPEKDTSRSKLESDPKPLGRSMTKYVSGLIKARVGEASTNNDDLMTPGSLYSDFSFAPTTRGFPTPSLTQYSDSPTLPSESTIKNRTLQRSSSTRTMGLPHIPMTPLMELPDATDSPILSRAGGGPQDVGEWWSAITTINSPTEYNIPLQPSPQSLAPQNTSPLPITVTQPLSILKPRSPNPAELSLQASLSHSPPRPTPPPPASDESHSSRSLPERPPSSTHLPQPLTFPSLPSTPAPPSPHPGDQHLTSAFRTRVLSDASTIMSATTSTAPSYPYPSFTSPTTAENGQSSHARILSSSDGHNGNGRQGRSKGHTPPSFIPGAGGGSSTDRGQAVKFVMPLPTAPHGASSQPLSSSGARLRKSAEMDYVHVEEPQFDAVLRAKSSSARVENVEDM